LASDTSGFEATGTPVPPVVHGIQGRAPAKGMDAGSVPRMATLTVDSQSNAQGASKSPDTRATRHDTKSGAGKTPNDFKGKVEDAETVD